MVGVQESQCLKELKVLIHNYLGGPSSYTVFLRELGDARMHGVIAVVVFVRTAHVDSGAFEIQQSAADRVAAGVSENMSVVTLA